MRDPDVDTLNSALMINGSELVALPLNSLSINKIGDNTQYCHSRQRELLASVTELYILAYGCIYTCDKLESDQYDA